MSEKRFRIPHRLSSSFAKATAGQVGSGSAGLEDIALGGRGATGIEFTSTTFDLQMIGLASLPPSGVIIGSVEVLYGDNHVNLTEAGNLGWAYWYADNTVISSAAASNEMAGAELIGIAQPACW